MIPRCGAEALVHGRPCRCEKSALHGSMHLYLPHPEEPGCCPRCARAQSAEVKSEAVLFAEAYNEAQRVLFEQRHHEEAHAHEAALAAARNDYIIRHGSSPA